MSILGLLDSLQNVLVEPERERNGQNGQRAVREDRDERHDRQRQEHGQDRAEDNAGLAAISPVNQFSH